MNTFYVAATNRMSWGRGTHKWEAIGHAISHGGENVERISLFEISSPDGSLESDVYVSEVGNIVAPKGSEVKELGDYEAKNIVQRFFAYMSVTEN